MYAIIYDKATLATVIGQTPRVGEFVKLDNRTWKVSKVTYVINFGIEEEILVQVESPSQDIMSHPSYMNTL